MQREKQIQQISAKAEKVQNIIQKYSSQQNDATETSNNFEASLNFKSSTQTNQQIQKGYSTTPTPGLIYSSGNNTHGSLKDISQPSM